MVPGLNLPRTILESNMQLARIKPIMTDREIEAAIMRAEKKIDRARQFTLSNEAFFAFTMKKLLYVMVDNGSTMATNAVSLFWDWRFIERMTQYKVNYINLHELLHVTLFHNARIKGRDHRLCNIAMDHVVNILLVRSGMVRTVTDKTFASWPLSMILNPRYVTLRDESYRMPADGIMDPKYAGMAWEDVYNILAKEEADKPEEPGKGEGEDGDDDGEDQRPGEEGVPGGGKADDDERDEQADKATPWGDVQELVDEDGESLSEEEMKKAEQEMLDDLIIAEQMAKGRGQMSAGMSGALGELKNPSQPWEEVLRDLMTNDKPAGSSYAIQNKRHPGSNLIYPGRKKQSFGNLCIMVDASGSVSQGEFDQFMGDVWDICEDLSPATVTMIQFDHRADSHEEIESGEVPELTRQFSGGTRFSAPFNYADAQDLSDDFDMILFFTDGGDSHYPENEPECPVIWASTGAFWGGNPPFGDCVQVRFAP